MAIEKEKKDLDELLNEIGRAQLISAEEELALIKAIQEKGALSLHLLFLVLCPHLELRHLCTHHIRQHHRRHSAHQATLGISEEGFLKQFLIRAI